MLGKNSRTIQDLLKELKDLLRTPSDIQGLQDCANPENEEPYSAD